LFTSPYKLNHGITARELRVIDETGENLGVMSKEAALKLATERGLDLIEVTAKAVPPVARIMSFDKFRYEAEKKRKEERVKQKPTDLKQVQIGVKSATNDLAMRARKIEEFLEEGHPVAIVMNLRGREKANKDWAKFKLEEFTKLIQVPFQRVMDIRWGGRGFAMTITKKS
jgi:translation initiation factor IF-3